MVHRAMLDKNEIASLVLAAVAISYVLLAGMVAALFAGLIVYLAITWLATAVFTRVHARHAMLLALAAVTAMVLIGITFFGVAVLSVFRGDHGLAGLFEKMAQIIAQADTIVPPSLLELMPRSADEIRIKLVDLLQGNAQQISSLGKETFAVAAHVLIAMTIGAMLAFHEFSDRANLKPFARALLDRVTGFSVAFRNVFFAQAKISAINTVFTALYLAVVLPLLGHELPYTKTMILITFFAGLLPVVGNLISNTVIVLISASAGFTVAVWSLVFLVVIHKLEYFINARIVGEKVSASAWELLLAMLVLESVFGVQGMVIAPILYAYIKSDMKARLLI